MRPMTKFYFGLVASFVLTQVFGQAENDPSTVVLPTSDQLTYILNGNPQFKACNLKLDTLKSQMEDLMITMKAEYATISSKMPFVENNFENHTSIKTALNNKVPELKGKITTIAARQEKIERGLNHSMEFQQKLESNEKLLPERTAANSVGGQATTKNNSRVAFFAQRNTSYNTPGYIIPYQTIALNLGGAFNKTTGIFHVPVTGVYHFYFTALKMKREISGTSSLTVQLKKIDTETVLAESHINSNDWYGWFPVQMQVTIYLDKGSLIGVKLAEGSIYQSSDESHLLTSFGGFLVSPGN